MHVQLIVNVEVGSVHDATSRKEVFEGNRRRASDPLEEMGFLDSRCEVRVHFPSEGTAIVKDGHSVLNNLTRIVLVYKGADPFFAWQNDLGHETRRFIGTFAAGFFWGGRFV